MRKQKLINLILFSLIIGLALISWLDPFGPPALEIKPLTATKPSSVTAISLIRADTTVFRLEKRSNTPDSRWYLTKPLQIPANPLIVQQILGLVNTNSFRQYQIKSEHLAKLGLLKPGWEIAFDFNTATSESATSVIQFGKTEPIEQKRYVFVKNTVHLINDRFSQFNFGSPVMFANLDILPVDKSVKEVHLPGKVIKKVDGQWQSSASDGSISQATYNEFIDEWRYAQAVRVALADKNKTTIDATPVTVILEKADQPVHFTIETSGPDFVVTNNDWGVRYYLNSSLGEKLLHIDKLSRE